jgi:putative phosphoesterase
MRLGLIGDIHGDVRALEAALRHLDALGVESIVCPGDLVGYGAQPDQVVELLQERKIPAIRGNHDRWALEKRRVIGLHGWKPARLKDETWAYLEALPTSLDLEIAGRSIAVHHGSPASDMEFVTPYKPLPPSVEQFWNERTSDLLILAHSHIPMIDRSLRGTIVNAGSVHGVPGVQTSYSFATVDLSSLAIRIYDVRLGREIRRDPIYLDDDA